MPGASEITEFRNECTLVVQANGGTVALEKKIKDAWIVADILSVDGVHRVDFGMTPTRITTSGEANYEISQ